MQEENNQPLTCWYPTEEYVVVATLPRHISKTDYDTTAVVLAPRGWRSGYTLVVRERAVGAKKDRLIKNAGLPYWNHALHLRITEREVEQFKDICGDADNCAHRFAELFTAIMDKAFVVKHNEYSIVTAMAVYGGLNDNILKGYITLPPVGCDYYKLKSFYDLWVWTKPR